MKLKLNSSSSLTLQFLSTSLFWTQTPHLDSMLDQEHCDVIRGVESVDQQPSDWWMRCVRTGSEVSWSCFLRMWEADRLHCERINRYVWSISVWLIHSIRLLEQLVLTSHWITNIHVKMILMRRSFFTLSKAFWLEAATDVSSPWHACFRLYVGHVIMWAEPLLTSLTSHPHGGSRGSP